MFDSEQPYIIPARPDEFIVKGATNLAVARHELATPLKEPAQGTRSGNLIRESDQADTINGLSMDDQHKIP